MTDFDQNDNQISNLQDHTNEGDDVNDFESNLDARGAQMRLARETLDDAIEQVRLLSNSMYAIRVLLPDNNDTSYVRFSHLTKEVRNAMLERMANSLGNVDDSVKAAFRATKSVKRSRLTDDQIDKLIINSNDISTVTL